MASLKPHERAAGHGLYKSALLQVTSEAQGSNDAEDSESNKTFKSKSGSVRELVKCPHKNCGLHFKSGKRLRGHKISTHDYCSTCDLDFEDDIGLIHHRIESTLQDEGKHIACLICGSDFGSQAGREAHFRQVSRMGQLFWHG